MLSISAVKTGKIAQKATTFKISTTDARNVELEKHVLILCTIPRLHRTQVMFHLSDCYFYNKDSKE